MLRKRGKAAHTLILVTSMVPSASDLVRGLWRGPWRKRWLVPLFVFLLLTAVLLAIGGSVEALAPFLYSIF